MQPVVGHFGSKFRQNEVMKVLGDGDNKVGKRLRFKVLTVRTSGGFFCPPASLRLSPIPLLQFSLLHFPSLSLSLSHYLPVTLFDLEIPTVCREGDNWEEGRGGGEEREGVKGGMGEREGKTDEGRTAAAGGCHGNREDCYTAHVNRQLLMGVGGGCIGGSGGTRGRRQWGVPMNDCLRNTHQTGGI